MRCFITGATGFVGGHLCERLASEGHEVLALARSTSNRSVLKEAGVQIVEGSIDSINVFAHHAESIDVVFHLAAVTKPVREEDFHTVNARGTERLMRGLARGDFKGRVVMLSSLSAGGPAKSRRFPRKEQDKDRPVSIYGRSKRAGEEMLKKHLPEGCTWTVLRPGAIYGPREHEIYEVLRMMARFGVTAQLGPRVHVQLTHVEDVVEGLIRAAFNPKAAGQTYYLTDRAVWGLGDITRLASEALGREVRVLRLPLTFGKSLAWVLDTAGRIAGKSLSPLGRDKLREMEARYWVADASRIQEELGWQPRWDFPQGLKQTLEWYRENGWL